MIQNDEHSNVFIEWCISFSQIQVAWMITNAICQSLLRVHAMHMRWMSCWTATGFPWGRTLNISHRALPPTRMQSWHKRENRSKEMQISCITINAFVLFCPFAQAISTQQTPVKYPYIQPGYKIQIQAPILPITRYYETSPNDSP